MAKRTQKRNAMVSWIEQSFEYQGASSTARLLRPDPNDLSYSKRAWEKALGRWRDQLRMSVALRAGEGATASPEKTSGGAVDSEAALSLVDPRRDPRGD